MLQQRVLRQVDCEMMDNLPLTANETASEMVLLGNAHFDCALYVCNPNTPPPPPTHGLTATRNVANVQMLPIANVQCPIGIGNIGNWQHFHIYTIIS